MTARIVVSCDGAFDDGRMPCRGALPTRETIVELAIEEATAAGWSMGGQRARFAEVDDDLGDLCPAHARQHR